MGDLLLPQASPILGTFEKLSNTEVLAGITSRASRCFGRNMTDRGVLAKLEPKQISLLSKQIITKTLPIIKDN